MKSLKQLAALALAHRMLVLDPGAPRGVFEEYVCDSWRDMSTFDQWMETVTGVLPAFGSKTEALVGLADMCVDMEPRYPWSTRLDDHEFALQWDLWCFCIARWARQNDVSMVSALPMHGGIDHRHAYAMSGPSANWNFLSSFACRHAGLVSKEWFETIMRPEMWNPMLLWSWVSNVNSVSSSNIHGQVARRLVTCITFAAEIDNVQAVDHILESVDSMAGLKDESFWEAMHNARSYIPLIAHFRRRAHFVP